MRGKQGEHMGKRKQKQPVGALFKPVPIDWKRECIKAQDAYIEETKRVDILRDDVKRLEGLLESQRKHIEVDHTTITEQLKRIDTLKVERDAADKARRDQLEISKFVDEDFMRMVGARMRDSRQMRELQDELATVRESGTKTMAAIVASADHNAAQCVLKDEQIESLKRQLTKQLEREAKAVAALEGELAEQNIDLVTAWRDLKVCAERDIERSLELGRRPPRFFRPGSYELVWVDT